MNSSDRPSLVKRLTLWVLLTFLVFAPLLFAGWAWMALHWTYAAGERAGYVQKISKKGWICKTWEGELAMANLPGTLPQIFNFSVRDDAVAHDLEHTIGQRVSISYEQHRGIPSTCFGETQYFVTTVHADSEPSASATPAAPASLHP